MDTKTITLEQLAIALHDSTRWPDLREGHRGEIHMWTECNEPHRDRHKELAGLYWKHLPED